MSASMIWSLRWFSCSSILVSVANLRNLHGAGNLDGGNALAIFAHRRMDRLHPAGEVAAQCIVPSCDSIFTGRSGTSLP